MPDPDRQQLLSGREDRRDERASSGTDDRDKGAGYLLLDAHVHLHDGVNPATFLAAARASFLAAGAALGLPERAPGVLALADGAGRDTLTRLLRWSGTAESSWTVRPTSESSSLVASGPGEAALLVLIAGRQIRTSQGLEVLALGTQTEIPDGDTLQETLARVREQGAIAVLPWGFGKWWFRRGRLVRSALREADPSRLFLGDNGGRPRFSPSPGAFRLAAELGVHVLPGSDPLPLAGQVERVGSRGAVVEGALGLDRPTEALRSILAELPAQPRCYGPLRPLLPFARDQVAMQLRKMSSSARARHR